MSTIGGTFELTKRGVFAYPVALHRSGGERSGNGQSPGVARAAALALAVTKRNADTAARAGPASALGRSWAPTLKALVGPIEEVVYGTRFLWADVQLVARSASASTS